MLYFAIAVMAMANKVSARDGFAIVIDQKSYNEAKTEVNAYAQTVEQLHNLKVYTVIDKWGVPDSIRATLRTMHNQKKEPIVGTILIGDIPVVMVRDGQHFTSAFKMNQTMPRKESSVPSDRFYDDFGLKFKYLDKDEDAPYYYYSITPESAQRLHPDIYSGRVRPTDAGGTSRYQKLREFLRKVVVEKKKQRELKQMFYFSGHGYISESKVARIDEKMGWFEHFPQLKSRTNAISYMDHTDHIPVKVNLMNEVMRTDLDLAVLHHHGYYDTQYLNGLGRIATVKQAKEFIRKSCREHIVSAKERGKDWEKMKKDIMERFDLPESWFTDVFDPQLNAQDSTEDANDDLHLEDFKVFGYKPNAPVVVIDACFCGSFHRDDCIADEYIFQPGSTVAVVANTVNVLQDKWSDRLIGLISEGGCVGDIVRYSTYLESHLIGDPTFRFNPTGKTPMDIDHMILENKASDWNKLLKSSTPELQSLAIEQLCRLGKMTSAKLRNIYENSPYGIVRLMALMKIVDYNDENSLEVIKMSSQDSYELTQRQALKAIHNSGDERLIPALIKVCIANNTSDRVNFDATMALNVMPEDKLIEEYKKQFYAPSVCYLNKDSVGGLIEKAVKRGAHSAAKSVDELLCDTIPAKTKLFTLRGQRNNLVHHKVPQIIDFIKTSNDTTLQVVALEALGWFPYSCQSNFISHETLAISRNEKYATEVRQEALKTYNRINGK